MRYSEGTSCVKTVLSGLDGENILSCSTLKTAVLERTEKVLAAD